MDEGEHHKAMRIGIGVGVDELDRVTVFVGNAIDAFVRDSGNQDFDPIARSLPSCSNL
jgi:hypothetical protein